MSEINREIQQLVEGRYHFVRIIGEISTIRRPQSGHFYFILKDNRSQIKAVLFKNQQRYLSEELKDGKQVVCDGRISVYEPRGEYQIIIDSVDFQGAGQLQLAYDNLKQKLQSLGFFDPDRKRALPPSVNNIILITSPGGAAVHDFLAISRRRQVSVNIQLLPVPVQGDGSVERICEALETAEKIGADVIVLCRGGGSMEDLWTFNDERLAHSIFHSTIPVVTGIGHETDITIADFCADIRAATPTAAAELIIPDGKVYRDKLAYLMARMERTCRYQFETVSQRLGRVNRILATFDSAFSHPTLRLDGLYSRLFSVIRMKVGRESHRFAALGYRFNNCLPSHRMDQYQNRVDHLSEKIRKSFQYQLDSKQNELQRAAAVLDSLSPLATLARGYAIVSSQVTGPGGAPRLIRDIDQVLIDDELEITLHDGTLECVVAGKRK